MTNERRPKTAPRYSQFSRSAYDDVLPPVPEDASLVEIAMRALNRRGEPVGENGAMSRDERNDPAWNQPPPPEPSTFWENEARTLPMPRPAPDSAYEAAISGTPDNAPVDAEFDDLTKDADVAPVRQDLSAEIAQWAQEANALAQAREAPPVEKPKRRSAVGLRKAGAKSANLLNKVAGAVRTKAAPALVRSAFWVAHNLRRKEIRKRYNRLLVLGHAKIVDRKLERLFFVPSRKAERINPATERGIHYDGPISSAVFDWVMALMPSDLRQFAFVDVRAARGRTSLLAAKRDFNQILAYEYDAEIFDDLQMNVAQYPRSRMTCRNIDCYRGDVDGIALPDRPCIIWFSSAWNEPMISGVMNYVRETYRQSPRRVYVVFENAAPDTTIGQDNIFDSIEPPLGERLKLRLLSPVDFKIYRSLI